MSDTLVVNEIYLSLQGESTFAGLPCVFVRLTGCNLRCSFCDTAYAFTEGKRRALDEVRSEVLRLASPYARKGTDAGKRTLPLVELTGGEPLLQPNALVLMEQLCDDGFTVLVETSGAHDIGKVDARVRRIMDLKCPSSGEWSEIVSRTFRCSRPRTKSNSSSAPGRLCLGQATNRRTVWMKFVRY